MTPQTSAVLKFLADPASYPHRPDRVVMVQTHASWVFIASPFVYKIKKPVNFGFLDFSTLDLRHDDCEREVSLNRRLAPDVYLGVEPISEARGVLHFGGTDSVVEWAVKMRELDPRFLLTHLLRTGKARTAEMDRIMETLQRFYSIQPRPPRSEMETATQRLRQSIEDNLKTAAEFPTCLPQAALEALVRFNEGFFAEQTALLDSRIREGWIRDCHGDLHAEHIHLTSKMVRIYDCIEFNTRFRYIDVACDLAFLAMDLDFHGRPDLARHLVERAAVLLQDDGLRLLMDFYKCYRACVRGKVELLHSRAETADSGERAASLSLAGRYFRLALRYAALGSRPCVLAIMGNVGSGKSTLGESLATILGCELLSSDRTRKMLAGVALHERGSPAERATLYSSEMSKRSYKRLFEDASKILAEGECVIIDATFSRRAQRDLLRDRLNQMGCRCLWIEAEVGEETVRRRLLSREADRDVISDARWEDYSMLRAAYEPPDEIIEADRLVISTESKIEVGTLQVLLFLVCRHVETWEAERTDSQSAPSRNS